MTALLILGGLVVLGLGADWLVRGASRLATAAGISQLVVGLTVVAFGTSEPEMSVSVLSALQGQTDVALGNVVGSNILNVLLILGLSATIVPLAVQRQLVRLDVPLMVGASVLVYLMALDLRISRLDAALLAVCLVGYIALQVVQGRKEGAAAVAARSDMKVEGVTDSVEPARAGTAGEGAGAIPGGVAVRPRRTSWPRDLVLTLIGLALLVLGSRWFVAGAVTVARSLGMSDLVIGLTLVALGTSLPEVATSVMASIKGERDLAVGNVVGSNLFNLLGVLGIAGVVSPQGIPVSPAILGFDLPVMTAVAVACLPVFFTGLAIARWEGILFLAYYVAYTAYIVLAAAEHQAAPLFGLVMLEFVIPLTVVTLGVVTFRGIRRRRRPRDG